MAAKNNNTELVWVEKDGERIQVHPGTLANHVKLGWKVVDPAALEEVKRNKAEKLANAKPEEE